MRKSEDGASAGAGSSKAVAGTPKVEVKDAKKNKIKKNICFVISPFGGWNDRYYTEVYMPAVQDAGLQPRRADDLYRPSAIVHDIWGYVKKSRVMLADLTGKNPNVFYELGLAHAIGKPVVLLTQDIDDIPFDLRALRIIEYEVEDPEWSTVLRVKIKKALEEVLSSPELSVLPTFLHGEKSTAGVKGSPLERQVLDLQRQVGLLSARSRSVHSPMQERIGPDEALDLMKSYQARGLPYPVIVRRLSERGVPRDWIMSHLDEAGIRRVRARRAARS